MTRVELILRTRQLIAEGERLDAAPSLIALQTWLQLSDDLLAAAWGSMDRYHLAWLMVGKPKGIVRGRPMTGDEEAAYVREVAGQKSAALRMSLDAVERQGMPFRGESGGSARGRAWARFPAHLPPRPQRARPTPRRSTRPRNRARSTRPSPSVTHTSRRARVARSPWTRSSRRASTRRAAPPLRTRIMANDAPRARSVSSADARGRSARPERRHAGRDRHAPRDRHAHQR